MAQSKAAATKRLFRDLREWKNCCHHAKCISAAPLENDIFEWHINFIPDEGPLKDIIFHLVMKFPDNYPLHHPYVTLKNYLHHPNVFVTGEYGHNTKCGTGYWICLDMIKCCNWSAAYSVSSILMQLMSFLITAKAPQDYGEDKVVTHSKSEIERMKTLSMQFQCDKCNHTFDKPFPAPFATSTGPPYAMQTSTAQKQLKMDNDNAAHINYWAKYMHRDVENIVVDFLNVADLLLFSKVNRLMKTLVFSSKSVRMARFSCWYNKVDLRYSEYVRIQTNDGIQDPVAHELLLGYGITPTFHNGGASRRFFRSYFKEFDSTTVRDEGLQFAPLKECDTTFDLLSKDAFETGKIRQTPMNDRKRFSNWLPMYIAHGRYHGIEALKVLKEYTLKLFQQKNVRLEQYHPFMSIHLICCVMSSLVVKLMEAIIVGKVQHSINVLETYFHFFHLLLAVYHKYYDILHALIQEKCVNFVVDMKKRSKQYVPNLGNFMIWFALCNNIPSKCIFQALLEESHIRNQRWIIKKFGANYEKKTAADFDINKAFVGAQVSRKLFMFQYFFMKKICGLGVISPAQKFQELNQSLGCVEQSVSLRLQSFCNKLDKIHNFEQFFGEIEMKYPGTQTMKRWLRKCVDISAERGYHTPSVQLQHKSDDKFKDETFDLFNYSLFFDAVHKNDMDAIKHILRVEADEVDDDEKKMDAMPLMDADNINWNKLENMDNINNINADTNDKIVVFDKKMTDKSGHCPVFIAANKCYVQMLKLLISKGFDVNMIDKAGKTAIDYTSDNIIIELIKNEQNKSKPKPAKSGFCASRYVQITGLPKQHAFNKEIVKLMFKTYGFNCNIVDDCIWFKPDYVLVKLRQYKINDKIENIARCFWFGHKIKAKICDLTELDIAPQTNIAPLSRAGGYRSRFPGRIRNTANGYNNNNYYYYKNNGSMTSISRGSAGYSTNNNGYNNSSHYYGHYNNHSSYGHGQYNRYNNITYNTHGTYTRNGNGY